MRVHAFLIGATCTLVGTMAGIQACGGDTSSGTTTTDAGNDVTKEAAPPPPPADAPSGDSATCDLSADFTKKIPDASIADGESSTGICIGCVEAKCKTDLNKCNEYCPCQNAAANALECYAKNADNPFKCAGTVAGTDSKTQGILLGLGGCLQSKCQTECPVPDGGFDAGGD